ncbi:MAG: hypothetical protein WBP88_01675 [Nitrososphaeraceae archaeon]
MQKALLDTQSKIKIERATEGLKRWFITRLEKLEHKNNALTIANFLNAAEIESNIAISYKEDLIFTLCKLSNYVETTILPEKTYFLIWTHTERR